MSGPRRRYSLRRIINVRYLITPNLFPMEAATPSGTICGMEHTWYFMTVCVIASTRRCSDFAISPGGRDVVYSTWDDTIYQCRIPREREAVDWTPLRINTDDMSGR